MVLTVLCLIFRLNFLLLISLMEFHFAHLDPLLLQTTVQGVDVGETFPDSSSASPVIDAGRIPAVSGTVGIDIRGFSRPSDYPGLGGSLTHDVGAFELHHSAGE